MQEVFATYGIELHNVELRTAKGCLLKLRGKWICLVSNNILPSERYLVMAHELAHYELTESGFCVEGLEEEVDNLTPYLLGAYTTPSAISETNICNNVVMHTIGEAKASQKSYCSIFEQYRNRFLPKMQAAVQNNLLLMSLKPFLAKIKLFKKLLLISETGLIINAGAQPSLHGSIFSTLPECYNIFLKLLLNDIKNLNYAVKVKGDNFEIEIEPVPVLGKDFNTYFFTVRGALPNSVGRLSQVHADISHPLTTILSFPLTLQKTPLYSHYCSEKELGMKRLCG